MRFPLRSRLLAVPLLLLAGTAAATTYAAHHAARAADERIQERIRAIASTLRGPPMFVLTAPVLEQLKNLTGAEFEIGSLKTFAPNAVPPIFRKRAEDAEIVFIDGQVYRAYQVELPASHPNAGATVDLYFPEAIRVRETNDAIRPVLWLGLGGGLLATVISLLVARRLVNRIREVEAGTRAVAAGAFDPLPLPAANDELRDLVRSVNEMAAKLASHDETVKQNERLRLLGQIGGGLAHQLRNAAAGARLAVQLAANDPEDREPLGVALKQLQRMESILRQFLHLGRPDERPKREFDLRLAIAKAIVLIRPRAIHQSVTIEWREPAEPLPRLIDEEQFDHLLENLLTNALEAAGPNGRVEITLDATAIEVIDSGPGPPPEIAARLFEPFATSKPGGIGLGLMVATQVADAHGAKLTWHRRQSSTVFRIEFIV